MKRLQTRHTLLLLLTLVLGTISQANAQEVLRLSYKDALKMALDNNTLIRNSQIDKEIAKKKVWETTAIGLPHVDSKAAYQYMPILPTLPADFMGGSGSGSGSGAGSGSGGNTGAPQVIELGVRHNVTFDITVSQLIFNGAYFIGLQATKALYEQTSYSYEKVVQDVHELTLNTYVLIQVIEESKKNLNSNLENVKKTRYEINEMSLQGFVEKTDVDQLDLTINTLLNSLNQIESNLEASYRLLKIQLGIDENVKVELSEELKLTDELVASIASLTQQGFVLNQNVDYRLLENAASLAKLDWKREITGFMPVITAFYNRQEKLDRPLFDFAPKDIFGVNLALPIFSSGQRMAAVSQKKLNLEKINNTKELTAKNLTMQATQFQNDLKLKLEKFYIQQKSLALADDIYKKTLEKYKNGVSSSMDLMNSQNQYLSSLTNYYQSIYDLTLAKTKLEKLFNVNQNIETK